MRDDARVGCLHCAADAKACRVHADARAAEERGEDDSVQANDRVGGGNSPGREHRTSDVVAPNSPRANGERNNKHPPSPPKKCS